MGIAEWGVTGVGIAEWGVTGVGIAEWGSNRSGNSGMGIFFTYTSSTLTDIKFITRGQHSPRESVDASVVLKDNESYGRHSKLYLQIALVLENESVSSERAVQCMI